jgi:acyl-homoserine-lactone acylase
MSISFSKATISLFLFLLLFSEIHAQTRNYSEHVEIVRDQWGVPHIYGKTDPDVAYGLAWANAEDDFKTMQENFLPVKGLMGKWKGKDGAPLDFLVEFLGSMKIAEAKYEKEISPEFKKYLEGYCQGVNDYAKEHPEEVEVKDAFPIEPVEVVATYHYLMALITALQDQLKNVMDGKLDSMAVKFASNAFAVNNLKSENGNPILVVNPHLRFEGWFSWYEAHLVSEEGMNMMGALFHGGTSVFVGTNEHLGWSHTWNKYDLVDTYKLKMHPSDKLSYEFDGEWEKLEKNKVKLKVKLKNWLPTITVNKTYYTSCIGPVLSSKNGEFYALRWGAMDEVRTAEQWYKMNKAENFNEFYQTLEMNALPRFNIVYADRDQNIFYIDNGIVPKRLADFEWKTVVPGNTSKAVWSEFYATKELPQVLNPDCGYVFNTNNTPFSATCTNDSLIKGNWDCYMDYRIGDNNRSGRFMELIEEKERVDFDDLKKIKFDNRYPKDGTFLRSISIIKEVDANKYPDLKEIILSMQTWDKIADPESVAATYYLIALTYIFDKFSLSDESFIDGVQLDETKAIEAINHTKEHLMEHFQTIQVPLKEIQVIHRGDKDYSMPGYPDVLAANYSKPRKGDGKFEGIMGDTYTMIVEYGKNGPIRIESLVNFGSSAHPESKHFDDQLQLWIKQQTKSMTFDREEILKNAERIYHPGM